MAMGSIRRFGFLLLAGLALAAITAPAASATPKFTAPSYPALFTTSPFETVFNRSDRFVVCESSSLDAEIIASSTTLTMAPAYSGCSTLLFGENAPSTFKMNGCDYRFLLGETAGEAEKAEGFEYTGKLDLACPPGQQIETTFYLSQKEHEKGKPFCTFGIASQTNLGSVDYGTTGSPAQLRLRTAVTGLAYTRLSGSLTCGKGTMSVSGDTVVTVTEPDKTPIAVTLDME